MLRVGYLSKHVTGRLYKNQTTKCIGLGLPKSGLKAIMIYKVNDLFGPSIGLDMV